MGKCIDLTGQRFGRWTVVELSRVTAKHQLVWACICDCGVQKEVSSRDLRSGSSTTCGCGRAKDLKGCVFGRLTVLSRLGAPKSGQRVRWNCLCECGSRKVIDAGSLVHGKTLSCGCLYRENRKAAAIDLWAKRKQFVGRGGYVCVNHDGRPRGVHRLVYQDFLGRPLQPWEHVHHKNGIRTDNRLENLELIHAGKHFAGQRPADIVKAKTDAERQRLIADGMALLAAAGVDLSHLSL